MTSSSNNTSLFQTPVRPDWEGFLKCVTRSGMPERVHHIELFIDPEVQDAVCARFGLEEGLDRTDPHFALRRQVRLHEFLGYDFIRCGPEGMDMPMNRLVTGDTAGALARGGGRSYLDEHRGPVTTWEEFEAYPWPDVEKMTTRSLEWCEENLPEGMCVVGGSGFAHFAEHLTWLMGYTTFCEALFERRDLIRALYDRILEMNLRAASLMTQFSCVKALWGSDDMGFRGGPLMSPDDLREFVLPGHKALADIAHAAGRPYLLHSCGNLACIRDDLVDGVGIDAKHSFEDTIEPVTTAKKTWGRRVALLGGIDVDFLCRADEAAVRRRVRDTLDVCLEGGGYCLGTGNSVANYIPLDNYLALLDEGRNYTVR